MKGLLVLIFSLGMSDDLSWIDYRYKREYYWGDLAGQPHHYTSENMIFYYALGSTLDRDCNGQKGSVIRENIWTGECHVMGDHNKRLVHRYYSASYEVYGVSVTYKGQQDCLYGYGGKKYAKTTFLLKCSADAQPLKLLSDPASCEIIFEKYDPVGCGLEFRALAWVYRLIYV